MKWLCDYVGLTSILLTLGLIVGGVVMLLSSGFLMVYDAHLTFFHGDLLSLVILIVLLQNNKRISTCIYKVNCKRL